LILNGDTEELHKFKCNHVYRAWKNIYSQFDLFARDDRLIKTVGNHDSRLIMDLKSHHPYKMDTVIRLTGLDYPVLIYHGHQVSALYERFNDISRIGVRYFAMPLGIMNYSVAYDSRKRHYMEKRIYKYSRQEQIVSIIGHTHRPLFESLSMAETLRFRIEHLLTRYSKATAEQKLEIEQEIKEYRKDLLEWRSNKHRPDLQSGLYDEDDIPVPCMFNSGTVIGKRGITCLELTRGKIRLMHWFDDETDEQYVDRRNRHLKTLPGGHIHRLELRQASMEYVMNSLRLLS
ncbi:MAG: metallophosphoesterase, partial [Spirochaetaceae bacterium]|nr:metallophosphoesterase [Spirochaetaceae bacterium]